MNVMLIELDDNMNIAAVQQLFNTVFPFLRIEFFEEDVKKDDGIIKRRHIRNSSRVLGEFRPKHNGHGNISIKPDMTVASLEDNFSTTYTLYTQVFRRSGNVWLETTITDGWSLEEQNRQGEMITSQMGGVTK